MLWPLLCASPRGVMPPRHTDNPDSARDILITWREGGYAEVSKHCSCRDANEGDMRKMNNYEFASSTKIMRALSASLKDEGEAISWLLSNIFTLSFSRELNLAHNESNKWPHQMISASQERYWNLALKWASNYQTVPDMSLNTTAVKFTANCRTLKSSDDFGGVIFSMLV